MSEINEFLTELDEKVKWELQTPVQIDDSDEFPDVERLGLESHQWVRIEDVVAVTADLKGSRLSLSIADGGLKAQPGYTRR